MLEKRLDGSRLKEAVKDSREVGFGVELVVIL